MRSERRRHGQPAAQLRGNCDIISTLATSSTDPLHTGKPASHYHHIPLLTNTFYYTASNDFNSLYILSMCACCVQSHILKMCSRFMFFKILFIVCLKWTKLARILSSSLSCVEPSIVVFETVFSLCLESAEIAIKKSPYLMIMNCFNMKVQIPLLICNVAAQITRIS